MIGIAVRILGQATKLNRLATDTKSVRKTPTTVAAVDTTPAAICSYAFPLFSMNKSTQIATTCFTASAGRQIKGLFRKVQKVINKPDSKHAFIYNMHRKGASVLCEEEGAVF